MTSTEGTLADALSRMSPENPDLTSLRRFAREVYAARGLSPVQLAYDLADDIGVFMVYVQRSEMDEVLGRRLSDEDMAAVRATLANNEEFEQDLACRLADALLVQAGISV